MPNLADLSDAELEAIATGDTAAFARATASRQGVRPDLVMAVRHQESGGNGRAVSPKGARGHMQLMPDTAQELGVDPDDDFQNIYGGVRYLRQQMDSFGGDETKALAAYNAGPGAVRKYGGVPPYAETQGYVKAILGAAPNISAASDEELMRIAGEGGASAAPAAPQPAPRRPPPPLRPDDALGFAKGLVKAPDNAAAFLEQAAGAVGLDKPINALGAALGLPSNTQVAAERQRVLSAAAADGRRPGMAGEFGGNVLGTLALGRLPGGPLAQGAASGALLSEDPNDAQGVLRDAAIGGVAGRVAAGLSDAAQVGLRGLLSKAPKVMSLPELEAAAKAAYQKVDASGFRFAKPAAQAMVGNVEAFLTQKGGKALYPEASRWVARLRTLANQKGGLPLSQLDDLRGDIYTALVKPGGKDSLIGTKIRQEIDALVSSAGKENELLREARGLYTRVAKARVVSSRLESADLARGRAYTGKNADNTIRQKLSPLIDPLSAQRFRNATPDEAAALRTAVTGSTAQNRARDVGALLDPRGILGMGLQAAFGAKTGGLTLPSALLGYAGTTTANRMSQSNVAQLLQLIAAGGSKEALKKVPTRSSYAAERLVAGARPAVAASAPALVVRPKKKNDR